MVAGAPLPSWSFLDDWTLPSPARPSWEGVGAWLDALDRIAMEHRAELVELRARWDVDLAELGGDPSATDWSSFAPLRRDREEDWSDWLGQLITDSATGGLAWHLFASADPRTRAAHVGPRVAREHVVEDRRADLVIEWAEPDDRYTHVEVKVGDPHLEKTPDTVAKVRRGMAHCRQGADFLLILPSQERAWALLRESPDPAWASIHMITWRDVAVALRRALLDEPREPVRWRVWAHAFCGAIEQELLGLPGGDREAVQWCRSLRGPAVLIAADVLREGRRKNEETHV